ncbi:Hypothetical predicted protein [Mytilus galloprovincialis]|uniref:Reverse transcriptase domain-containing protein n=1 Tax=Mytilus galloprovincialis TaxID=29158 RepID=A0A8B6BUI0_MYTGA|nr:Hypothetical predicted protein [Mytilus galloprovincialis]
MSTTEFSNLGKSEDTWTCPSCSKPNNYSTKIYFISNGDSSKHSTLNISTNPLMADSISEASIPSTSGSSTNSPSFNCSTFCTDIPIMTTSPKPQWSGGLSRPFPEKQGVRQGGVWSPTAYKIFINPLLDLLQKNGLGCYIGSIYCGTPTVADDICLASNCPYELQAMLDLQENYALQENYTLSETKSTVLVTGNQDTHEFLLNGSLIQQSETATHLGITRDSKSRFDSSTVVQERISTARRATYAMMGAGLNGILNGLNPCVSLHLIRIYIIPRLTYGLEAIRLAAKDLTTINQYYKRLLKQIQHLPDKAADSACYLLLGEPPIKAEIHRRILTTFGNIIRNFDSIEHQLAWRQLATKSKSSNSWFIMVKSILEQYDLPSCYDLLQNPPGKLTWKELVKRTVNSYWDNKLKLEAASKSSLKYVDIDRLSIGKTHLIWSSAGQNTHAITKASIKCRMLLGVYTLQANRHKFNQYEVEPTCPLCKQGPEDRTHFLVQCQHLTSIRQPFIDALSKAIEEMSPGLYQQITPEPTQLTQIILDCSSSHLVLPQFYNRLECISRGLCYALHIARSTVLPPWTFTTSNVLELLACISLTFIITLKLLSD